MTADSPAEEKRSIPAIETTLLRVVAGFRIVGACWLILLAILVLATEPSQINPTNRMLIVGSTMAIAVGWTPVTVILAYRRPAALTQTAFLVIDLVLAAWTALAPALIESDIFFAGGYPISSAFLVATTKGIATTLAPAALIAATSVYGVSFAGARAAEVVAINLLSPLVVAWGFGTIKIQDRKRRDAEEALALERTKLARADERAEVAAHLHDSVLQTLALIQRRSPENREVTRLARRQERQLRAWLNGGPSVATGNTLSSALIRAAEEVEDEYNVIVEMSTAGDRELDERFAGVVLAAREALTNAARFSGVDRIYVLAEASGDQLRLVVRDQGAGFDPDSVSEDRRGVRESIVGRLERIGGTAIIRSSVGGGTEVELSLGDVTK